jgi:hypothetical protein
MLTCTGSKSEKRPVACPAPQPISRIRQPLDNPNARTISLDRETGYSGLNCGIRQHSYQKNSLVILSLCAQK